MVPQRLHFFCTSCRSELAVPQLAPGQVLEGPCPFCNDHQRFEAPQPTITAAIPAVEKPAAQPRKFTIVDTISIATILGLLVAIANTATTKFNL